MSLVAVLGSRIAVAFVVALLGFTGAMQAQDYPHTAPLGAPFVPLDSWVYGAFQRLEAFGFVQTALEGMKPWTRIECARLTEEAGELLTLAVHADWRPEEQVVRLHGVLEREFAAEIEMLGGSRGRVLRLDTMYARLLTIGGSPLMDGFHFGQTIAYDFGRPFRRGSNAVSGGAIRGNAGPVAFFVHAEYQHAPAAPALSDSVRALIAAIDVTPAPSAEAFAPVNRLQLLDAYLSFNLKNWQLSFGNQSLSWGPGFGGSLILSNNAAPLLMLRATRVVPFKLPVLLRYLGPVRMEHFAARPRGYAFTPGAFLFGQKISFKPRPYLEIGVARSFTLGGRGGDPLTSHNFFRAVFGIEGSPTGAGLPGDSRSEVDWSLRVPGLRNRLILYAEMYADDDKLPYLRPSRGAFRPGLYLTQVPGIPKLDFAFEAASSESPGFHPVGGGGNTGQLNYWNGRYRDGYRNAGFLLGNTVGRMGRAFQAWTSYHFSPLHVLQFSFGQNNVAPEFIPGGGSWQDFSARHEIHFSSGFYMKSWMQLERIRSYPALFSGPVRNVAAAFEFGFVPEQHAP